MRTRLYSILIPAALVCLTMLITPIIAEATKYNRPAFLSNLYFTYKSSQKKEKNLRPDIIINSVKANDPQSEILLVADLIGNKGTHQIEIEIFDKNVNLIAETYKLAPWKATEDDMHFNLTTTHSGNFPEGGIFFKIYDTLDNGEKVLLGIFRLLTVK
jgi:hypothetical protein